MVSGGELLIEQRSRIQIKASTANATDIDGTEPVNAAAKSPTSEFAIQRRKRRAQNI